MDLPINLELRLVKILKEALRMKLNFIILKVIVVLSIMLMASNTLYAYVPCGEGTDIECPGGEGE